MFCINCGAQLPDGSKFCCQCGTALPVIGQAAPQPAQPVYQQPVQQPVYQQPVQPMSQRMMGNGAFLMDLGDMTMYEGEPKMGIYRAAGKMTLYDNRLEYKKTAGDGRVSIISYAGQFVANAKAKKEPPVVYYLQDLAEVRVGKYMGMYTTLVLQFLDGQVLSFAPKSPGSKIAEQAVPMIQQYLY